MSAAPDRARMGGALRTSSFYLVLMVLTLVFVLPLLWMLLTSVKTNGDATHLPLSWLPRPFTTGAYTPLFEPSTTTPVLRWFVNSMIAATAQSALILATASAAAYALARLEFPGKRLLFGMIVSTLFIPVFVFLIPNFIIANRLGWLNTLWALIVPGAAGAFGVFFLRQFFLSLPRELEEAALLDGANHWQVFTQVVLPLSKPALATLGVLSFLTNWNDFLWPVYVLFSPDALTLPAGLKALQGAAAINYPIAMAGAVVASVPVVILFVIAQRYVIESVARTGLKG